ncbi:15469_t:CDS:2 [Dentiscutata heterogama]|uniref:15469_t:CDS:1 n=1 Tax=Dentiscutata heterogama TaxID=1316150 RepID=A0ACA9JYC3_9GLOM|nr:15469_t:CDS:2 [Dentiscutata heterogama]
MDSQVKVKIVINSVPHNSITLDENLNLSEAYHQIIKKLGSNFEDPRYKYFLKNLDKNIEHDKPYSTKLKLSEIIDHKSGIIYLNRILKVKINVTGNRPIECEFGNLDDNLFNIRKRLLHIREKSQIKIIPRFFKFLSEDGTPVTEFGEQHTTLGGILGTNNVLRISLDEKKTLINQKSSTIVTIHKHLHSGSVIKYTVRLFTYRKLDYVRSILKMGPNLNFYHIDDEKISRFSEISTDWADIAWVIDDKLHLKICQEDDRDWNKLIEQCDMGFTYEKEHIKFAYSQAFTINVTKINPIFNPLYSGKMELKCEQKFDSLFKECLIVNGEIAATSPLPYLPYLSLFAGISYKQANELYKSRHETTRYLCDIICQAKLSLDKKTIILNKDFINEIKSALNDEYTNDMKINELRKVFRKYGHFYASEVIYGGAIIVNFKNTNTKRNDSEKAGIGVKTGANMGAITSTLTVRDDFQRITSELLDISKKKLTIVGGNEAFYIEDNNEAIRSWRNSVNNSKYWRIISYNIRPIIDLLDVNLKNQILEIFGKKILRAGITTHTIDLRYLSKEPIIVDDLSNIFRELTSNPSQCQIFASIMNQDDHIYSLRVDYADEYSPFMFEQRNNEIDVTICEKMVEEMQRQIRNNYNTACLFVRNFDSSYNIDNVLNEIPLLKVVYSAINMGDNRPRLLKVKWNNNMRFNINLNMPFTSMFKDNSKKLIICEEDGTFHSILENCVKKKQEGYELGCPLLINIMNECEYHGFVNINRKSPLYYSMNHSSSESSEFEGFISYLSLPTNSL